MPVVISWLKDNYLDLAVKAFLSILSIVLLLLRFRASKKLKNSEQLSAFLQWIPTAVKFANDLFPIHGDGSKRLNYVVEKCSSLFPLISLNTIVESVDQILSADKKGGENYESEKSPETQGSENLRQDCESDFRAECLTEAVQRRNTSLDFDSMNPVADWYRGLDLLSKLVEPQANDSNNDFGV